MLTRTRYRRDLWICILFTIASIITFLVGLFVGVIWFAQAIWFLNILLGLAFLTDTLLKGGKNP